MEDFDLDKWRAEYPMDFLLAIQLIMNAPVEDKGEVFRAIFDIAKMHVPRTLFKFYSFNSNEDLNQAKLDTLKRKQVYLSEIKELNDPFDSKAIYYEPERLRKFRRLKHCGGRIFDDLSTFARVACFTECNTSNQSMWASYSNNHAGYCVSYDITQSNPSLKQFIFPVQYTNKRYNYTDFLEKQVEMIISRINRHRPKNGKCISLDDLSLPLISILAENIKGTDWQHEKEFRCTTGNTPDIQPFLAANPKEIFIGMKCLNSYSQQLSVIGRKLSIPTYKMRLDDTVDTFCLVADRIS